MQSVCKVRSRARGVSGPFFLVTAGILVTSPQRFTGHHGASLDPRLPDRRRLLLPQRHGSTALHRSALILVTRAVLATALVTTLGTRFSSNRYVFL